MKFHKCLQARVHHFSPRLKVVILPFFAAKFLPVAYGIQKIQISCVVEDDKIGTDFLEEKITEFEDYVSTTSRLH